MVARKGFASAERDYVYPYPVYRSPILGAGGAPSLFGRNRSGSMGLTTVLRDYGTEILNAIRENDVQKLRFILEKTLRSDAKIAKLCVTDIKHKPTKKFACPLILAARQEDSRIMKYMMDKGTDPNFVHHTIFSSKRREIVTALHLAVDLGYYDTTEVLLNANADANIYDHNQETPLHIAVKKADHTMMRLLLSKGADPSIADRKTNAALHIATLYGHLQMVRTLLKYDADIYQKGQWDAIAPHIAAKEGHIHLIQLFSSNDIANINVKIPCYADRREKAPIHLAAENGHTECLLVLLDQFDADVNLKDSDGNTALHCVVLHPYDVHRMRDKEYFTESARVLLKFRISINEKNVFGDTALHFAAMNHYHRIVELLLESGANPFLENEDGMKPIDTVPDSDPVTKQILKMAMTRGRPTADVTMEHQRRLIDSTMNSGSHEQTFDRASRSNVSHRSVSSMSSVFVDDVKTHRSHKSRDGQSKRSRSRSKNDMSQSREEALMEQSDHEEQNGETRDVHQKTENEIPFYSKVDKRKAAKHKGCDTNSNLGYDQQEWEQVSTTTVNDDDPSSVRSSVHGSVRSIPRGAVNMTSQEVQADIHRRNRHQQTATVETAEVGTQQDYVNKKNKKNKQRKPSSENDEISLDTAIPEPVPEAAPRRVGQPGEVIYENIPPAAPPLPPRKNRPTASVGEDNDTQEAEGEYREENGVKVHTVPGRPGTIEVQYKGGPITISVDTPKEYFEGGVSDGESEQTPKSPKRKCHPSASPKPHRKHAASPKVKRKQDQDEYYDQEAHQKGRELKSQKHKRSPHKPRKSSDDYEQEATQDYYNEYYQQKYVKKKVKSKSKHMTEGVDDPYAEIEQSIDDYFNGTYDISELETLQQSMLSEASQPELIKRIIQQKIAEVTEQRAKEAEGRGQSSRDQRTDQVKMQQWLMQTEQEEKVSDEEQEEDEDEEDQENILNSDEWEDDMEFQTPDKWLDADQYGDDADDRQRGPAKGPMRSTPLKQKKPKNKKLDKDVKSEEQYSPKKKEQKKSENLPPTTKTKSPRKVLPKVKITQQPAKPMHSTKMEDSASHDDDGSISPDVSPNNSPKPMSFRDKLAWAQALDSGGEGGETPMKIVQPSNVSSTPKKSTQPSAQIVVTAEVPKWKVKPGQKSTVVESTEQKQTSETSEERSQDMDGDDEHEDDSSAFSDLTKKMPESQRMYYSITHDIEGYSSSSSATTGVSSTYNKKPLKSSKYNDGRQEPIQEIEHMEVGEYEGSPFSRRKEIPTERNEDVEMQENKNFGKMQYDEEPVSPRRRTKSQNDVLDEEQHRAVSPVNLRDIGERRGERTNSVISEGRGLGLRISGDVPKAYSHKDRSSARRAFMLASPAKIESSSECSDSEILGSRGSLSELGYAKDRGQLWSEPLMKPVYPKNTSDMLGTSPKPDAELSPRSDDSSDKEKKIIGGYAKPYKSFGKINVKTDLIEEAMMNSSITEDPENNSDLEPLNVSDFDEDQKFSNSYAPGNTVGITVTEITHESRVEKPHVMLEELDREPGGARYPRQMGRQHSQMSEPPPPLPLNSPPVMDHLEQPQLSPRSDTSSRSGRKVVSVKEEHTNERGETVETITTTVIRQDIPYAEVIQAEMVAPTDDLSFGDSTFDDDLDDMVLENAQVEAPSELPPPPPELMQADDCQEKLEPLVDMTNKISVHVEEIDEKEAAQYMAKDGKSRRKSKSKKSTENLADPESKKKKKKKKVKELQEDVLNDMENSNQQTQEKMDIEKYHDESGINAKTSEGIPTFLTVGHQGVPMKPSEVSQMLKNKQSDGMGIMDYDAEPGSRRKAPQSDQMKQNIEEDKVNKDDLGIMDYDAEPGARQSRRRERQRPPVQSVEKDNKLGIMDYDTEPGARKSHGTHKPEGKDTATKNPELKTESRGNQSMTDMEVAEITDAAEARRRARESARAQRQWHKQMLEEGKDPNLMSRSHSRETSKNRQRRSSKEGERKVSPSPTRKISRSSPNSYTIVVEGGAEVTTSKGRLPTQPSPQGLVDEEEEGSLLSLGSKRGKKKKTKKSTESLLEDGAGDGTEKKKKKKKKVGSTDDLSGKEIGSQDNLAVEKKKKKKKKTGSHDDIASMGKGSVEDLAPKGKVQGPPPGTAISDVWKEAMSGQPLASSETVYQVPEDDDPSLDTGSAVRKSKRGKKKKKSTTDKEEIGGSSKTEQGQLLDKAQTEKIPEHQKLTKLKPHESPSSMEISDPSLEHMIKRAVVPIIPKVGKYEFDSDEDLDESQANTNAAPTLEIGSIIGTKKQQRKLDKLGKKYKVSEGTTVDESPQQQDEDMESLDRPPRPGRYQQEQEPKKHAVNLHHASIASSEDSDLEEPMPASLVQRAQIPKGISDRQTSYETNLDYIEPMDEDQDDIPTMNLTDTQRADILKARKQKKQMKQKEIERRQNEQQKEHIQNVQLEVDDLQEAPRPRRFPSQETAQKQELAKPKHGMRLQHESKEPEDDDSISGHFVKRVTAPVRQPGQRGIYETGLDTEEPFVEAEHAQDIRLTESQKSDLFKARELKKQQKEIARQQQNQLEAEQQQTMQVEVDELQQPPQPRRFASTKISQQQESNIGTRLHQESDESEDDDSMSGQFVKRVSAPVRQPGQRGIYETSLDSEEPSVEVEHGKDIRLTEAQKADLYKAREVKRQQNDFAIQQQQQQEAEQQQTMQVDVHELQEPPQPRRFASQGTAQQQEPIKPKHGIQLNQESEESEDDDSMSGQFVKRVVAPVRQPGQRGIYETSLDSEEPSVEAEHGKDIRLTEAQKAEIYKARELKKQQQKEDIARQQQHTRDLEKETQQQLQAEQMKITAQFEVDELQEPPRSGRYNAGMEQKHEPSRPKFGIQLNQKSEDSEDEDSLSGQFMKRVSVPVTTPGQKGIYEATPDDSEEMSFESGVARDIRMTEAQKAEMRKAKEVRRLQQSMDKIAKRRQEEEAEQIRQHQLEEQEKQRQLEMEEQARLEAQFENLDEPPRHGRGQIQPLRPQHGVNLAQRRDNTPDDDDSLPESLIKRATVPQGVVAHRFEISQEDSDDDDDINEINQISSISLSDAQKVALAKAREEKRHAKAQEKKERNRQQQEDSEDKRKYSSKIMQITDAAKQKSSHSYSAHPEPQRQKYSMGLTKPGTRADFINDTDESIPEDMFQRAGVPEMDKRESYETNLDDFELGQTEVGSVPMIGLSDTQKAAMASIRETKRQQQLQKNVRTSHNERQNLDEEGYLVPQLYAPREQTSDRQKDRPHHAININQPYPNESDYLEIDDPMPDDMIRRVAAPNLPPMRQGSFEASQDDISQEDDFKNAAFSALKKMQGQSQKPHVAKKPQYETELGESAEANQKYGFSRSASGRIRIKKGARPPVGSKGNEIFIDRQPDLIGEDALPPDGNTDAQLQQELAKLRGEVPTTTPLMSELWQDKKDQENEMQLMLQAINDPSELEPTDQIHDNGKAFRGRLPAPPTEPLPSADAAALAAITNMNTKQLQQSSTGSYKPPRHPSKSDRRPPRVPHMNDSLLSNQSSPGKEYPSMRGRSQSPRTRAESPVRPHSDSEGRHYEPRARSGSDGRSPRHMQPVKRRIRKAYPSEGDLQMGHQSDSEVMKRSRRGKSISFYGDFRKESRKKQRDKAPVMKASQSLEEAAWSQIRKDMENQPKLQAHRVFKPHGDKPINYTRGVYRPTPVYWRGSQRSLANTSRYDDSELIDQLWNERHRSMGTESEGDADMEDMSYDANMPDDRGPESPQFGYGERFGSSQFSQSIPDDERIRMAQYNSAPQLPSSAPPYGVQDQYFGAFQPVGPPKKVTIVDKKRKHKKVYKDQKDLPPRMLDAGPVNFKNYGAAAKLWMEQVEKSETQKSTTMYLSTMGDQQPPPEIVQSLPETEEGGPGAQWVIARGRSLRLAKYEYERQKQMGIESEPDQGPLDPGKQMLLFFKIGENWKDLAWVLFDGLQSDGDTLRMLKEIQHRHPEKVNDQVHDVMHRWWKKKGAAATIEELQRSLEILKMAYVEEEYLNPRGIFSEAETEPEVEMSTASEDDAEVNRLIHDYKNRSLNGSFENKNAQNSAMQLKSVDNNNAVNADSLLKKLEEAAVDHIPSKINRSSLTRGSPQPGKPRHEFSHEESDFENGVDDKHAFVIVQPQLSSKEYKHETNM